MEKNLQVYLPYPKTLIAQRFGDNANSSYARDGLKGHTAYDWGAPWGAPIPNCTKDAYCYSIMNYNDPDPTHYRAVFMIVETETGVYEVSYGHCSDIFAKVGQVYQPGDTIANIGNTGDVFSGDHEVTKAERLAGSHAGAHLHGPQIRVLKKVTAVRRGATMIQSTDGTYLQLNGFYFEVPDYNNGYNGCVSMAPFSTETLAIDYHGPILQPAAPVVLQQAVAVATAAVNLAPKLPPAEQAWWLQIIKNFLANFHS